MGSMVRAPPRASSSGLSGLSGLRGGSHTLLRSRYVLPQGEGLRAHEVRRAEVPPARRPLLGGVQVVTINQHLDGWVHSFGAGQRLRPADGLVQVAPAKGATPPLNPLNPLTQPPDGLPDA